MSRSEQQSFSLLDEIPTHEKTYLLETLEVFNWGPFANMHCASIDPKGTAIIGPTGSGKTTLIDALMTLLVAQPRYNLASTGGHESDRDLISYVRGVLGGDGSDGREEVARPGKTMTGLCATYHNGEDTVKLAALLWTDGSSNATQDLKRRWLFSMAEGQSLEHWLRLLHEDGIRDLMKLGRDTGKLRIFDSKKAYLAHARKFFDVGENAFTLLNRAAGLKQLHSIDEIFRDLVLDDRTAFDRALEVAGEFDNLKGIHAELETARRQHESLSPIAEEHRKLESSRAKTESLRKLKGIVPLWYAQAAVHLWSNELRKLASQHDDQHRKCQEEILEEKACETRVNTLRERYLELGGNVIAELENTMAAQRDRVVDRSKHAKQYARMVEQFDLPTELTRGSLQRNQLALVDRREDVSTSRNAKQEETLTALSQKRDLEQRSSEVEAALRKVKERPGSNIPPKFQDFRAELADRLALAETDLPFVAELVEVKPEEAAWRGAIERAIGSERLRILVPEKELEVALRWVNDRDNRLHVRLQSARSEAKPGSIFPDGFIRKLNFKSHALTDAVRSLLESRDRHCVASPEALRQTEHGLTMEGMMSGRRGQFEKQDQRRLDADWMTGFDNKDQLEALAHQFKAMRQQAAEWDLVSTKLQNELAEFDGKLQIIERLIELDFSTIDLPGAEADLANSEQRLASLLDPNSDTSQAKGKFEEEHKLLEAIRRRVRDFERALAVLEERQAQAEAKKLTAEERLGEGLNEDERELAQKKLRIDPDMDAHALDQAERGVARDVEHKLTRQVERVQDFEKRLIRLMEAAQNVDTGALAETGSELEDLPDYLERLRVLNEEALPEKLSRFRDYLNRSSDQGVTQLLSGIAEDVDGIEQRIAELNRTLVKVDFRSGRYLQLQPQRIKHERLRSLETAMRKLRSAALKDDEGASHYRALEELVQILREAGENRRQQGSRALLDPRYRLQFFVVEVDRKTGDRSPPRTGSQSGSGGEKELMASHILTASLSYALCPPEANRPLYGTVVLDEAFSKSSPSAASRIIEALRIFHLHPIFVTPNKEIGLLKQHTRKVICVQRPQKQASLASISWEKLESLAPPR